MVGLTDTHCHLNLNLFQHDLADVLARAWDQGVEHILIPGIDLETSYQAVEMANRDPRLHAAVGFHPNDASKWEHDSINQLTQLATDPSVVAIGEIGLDFYRDRAPREVQHAVLSEQLELAASIKKPVILHSRNAMNDLWPVLRKWQIELIEADSPLAFRPGVFHSFDGDARIADQIVQQHFFIGISGPVTFKNAEEKQRMVSELPLNALLLETDAPFLAPHPHRGKRNEPAYVAAIAGKIASLKQKDLDQVIRKCAQNAQELFNWE